MKTRYLIPFLLLPFTACKKDGPTIKPIDVQVNLNYAEAQLNTPLDRSKVELKLTNLSTGNSAVFKASEGVVNMDGLAPGKYDIDASVTITKEHYKNLTGIEKAADLVFNASLKNYSLNFSTTIDLELVTGLIGDFVIKQIYYAGSDNKEGAIFRDQFVEIHNNTDRVLYADSLYIARAWGRQSPNKQSYHYQSNEQLDWSKSISNSVGEAANTDYVYLSDLLMIPGNGKTYPVQPGKSIVIAQNALNHKVPFVDNNGKETGVRNPDLTVDLSKADFEVHYGGIPGKKLLGSDIDNLDVPNLEILAYEGSDWVLDANGRDSYVIFRRSSRAEVTALKEYYAPLLTTPGSTANMYRQLPIRWIMDGVEIQPTLNDERIPKKLPASVDAGFSFVPGARYSSQAVIRKTETTENGRVKLKDSNNSTEDFVTIKASPWGFAN
ncbi:DUF4876 domain-containing protein [Sphingobacterium faecale]|uniref:DUF4876 domain-containing protein n=1 Tax=Sphingobacterium faecale TaxID=2803775 RepID=A0ABS1QYY2_9SPHI|nr:DUF4876 domain-containing protein [Sphingobacterium faecale]MBL1407659.1 DUF4876 domain-containing protein [Sphingobacterium faecale]